MVTVCWSAKGGSGVTVTACALAVGAAAFADPDRPVLLVDLGGDVPHALGVGLDPAAAGVTEWLAADRTVRAESLEQLLVPLRDGLALLPAGRVAMPDSVRRLTDLAAWLRMWRGPVVVDLGANPRLCPPMLAAADSSLMVIRCCYLAGRAASERQRPDGLVVIEEPGRSLECHDLAAALGVPVVARIPLDPSIARSVDAGMLLSRLPRLLARSVRPLLHQAAGDPAHLAA